MTVTRRAATIGLAAVALSVVSRGAGAGGPTVAVSKDPSCGCCSGWVDHLRAANFSVEVRDVTDLNRIKARLGVPADLAACHTAEVQGYVIEGHVPAPIIRRLLAEKPNATGLAVPGMPVGSPGMEVPDTAPEEYAVILFGGERQTYARLKGTVEVPR